MPTITLTRVTPTGNLLVVNGTVDGVAVTVTLDSGTDLPTVDQALITAAAAVAVVQGTQAQITAQIGVPRVVAPKPVGT